MSELMEGYDMLVAVTQKEVNNQFYRMASGDNPTIDTMIKANNLSSDVMMPGSYSLASYLRGGINPPTVQFYNPNSTSTHDQVLFQINFAPRAIEADNEWGLDLSTFQALNNGMKTEDGVEYTYGCITNIEDIHYTDNDGHPQVLNNQTVNYFLRSTSTTVGTIATTTYELLPSLFCMISPNFYLVDLSGLQVSFMVNLSQIPTTTSSINDLVARGFLAPEVGAAITTNSFNSNEFSLSQLFLDFNTVDFTQWSVSQPQHEEANEDTTVNMMNVNSHTYAATPLSTLQQNSDFTLAFTSNLENAFGLGPQDNVGATPYIININAAAIKPSQNSIVLQPSLVPSYIAYGAIYNSTDPELSTINYQIMGGDNGPANAPSNDDDSIPYVTDRVVNSTDYSGSMLYNDNVLFTPYLLNPIKQSLNPGGSWSQNGNIRTSTNNFTNYPLGYDGEKTTFLGTGYLQRVIESNYNNYTITTYANKMSISASMTQVSTIEITPMLLGWNMGNVDFTWTQTYSVQMTQDITWSINNNNELVFSTSNPVTTSQGPTQTENFLGNMTEAISDLFGILSFNYFDPVEGMLDDQKTDITNSVGDEVANIGAGLSSGFSSNFISPTGQVFLLANPVLDNESNFRLNVTYDI